MQFFTAIPIFCKNSNPFLLCHFHSSTQSKTFEIHLLLRRACNGQLLWNEGRYFCSLFPLQLTLAWFEYYILWFLCKLSIRDSNVCKYCEVRISRWFQILFSDCCWFFVFWLISDFLACNLPCVSLKLLLPPTQPFIFAQNRVSLSEISPSI